MFDDDFFAVVFFLGAITIAMIVFLISWYRKQKDSEYEAQRRYELEEQHRSEARELREAAEREELRRSIVAELKESTQPKPTAIPLAAALIARENEYVDAWAIDLSTPEGIASIPNSFFNVGRPNEHGHFDTIGDYLQKQATIYKNSGDSEMEIACLQKYVDIAVAQGGGHQPSVDRLWKELFRLRRFEEADRMKKIARDLQIKQNKENAERNYKMIGDAPYVIESIPTCPKCYDLSQHVYSRSPKLQSEYILPPPENDVAERLYCDLCGCYMGVYPFYNFDKSTRQKIKIDYEELAVVGGERLSKRRAQIEYDWLYRHMPDDAPKSVAGYIKMKKANSENFYKLQCKAEDRGYILYDWMQRWCFDPIENYITED